MISFAVPLILLALIALPLLWILLRAVPPAPVLRRFPAVTLLLGLRAEDTEADTTPWWLLLLRLFAIASLIVAFAGPFWQNNPAPPTDRPLLVVMDGGWPDAPDWPLRQDRAADALDSAAQTGRPVAFVQLTDLTQAPEFGPVALARDALGGVSPKPWLPGDVAPILQAIEGPYDTYWIAGPIAFDGGDDLAEMFAAQGTVTVFAPSTQAVAVRPATLTPDGVALTVVRADANGPQTVVVDAVGTDPTGQQRFLGRTDAVFDNGDTAVDVVMELPAELRDRVTRYQLRDRRTAGSVTLADDRLQRREIALVSSSSDAQEGLAVLSQLHFLRQALVPSSDLLAGAMQDILQANPDTLILADVPQVPDPQAVLDWIDKGGLLIRFAGPRLAAQTFAAVEEDPLLPVRLRAGGRTVGGAMSWGAPKTLQPFAADSPFYGLAVPNDVTVSSQVLAEPGPDLAARVIARLDDGTPLVTRDTFGNGEIVLFHVTANADWSSLPLSGLFMDMLERLSVTTATAVSDGAVPDETIWSQSAAIDGFGNVTASNAVVGVESAAFAARPSADLPPGLYAGGDRVLAHNVVGPDTRIAPPIWPSDVVFDTGAGPAVTDLKPWLLMAALLAFLIDIFAALWLSGKLRGPVSAALFGCALLLVPGEGSAQDQIDDRALQAASEVVLAYVITGDAQQDAVSRAGLLGLSQTLFLRTAIEPVAPTGIDLQTDDIALYSFLYWPVTLNQQRPTAEVTAKLNRYLTGGGMILFDTRDGNVSGFGSQSPEMRKLRDIAAGLQIPRLEPIPPDHVLTRSFYILQDFPGRFSGAPIWVEASPDVAVEDGMPFRNLNDGVTPVVVGGNDWAAAWAVGSDGRPMLPVGRGFAGERQRELARRFGVNLIMHVLTGNYKSDQVHVPDLLDRLGQ